MTDYEQSALVWQKIEDSEKLHEIYGCYPTFHDASLIKVDCNFEKREVFTTLYYADLTTEDIDSGVATSITLCWQNLIEADFGFYDNDIDGIRLNLVNEKFEAVFIGAYFEGRLLSENYKII